MASALLSTLVLLLVGQTVHSCSITNAVLEQDVVYTLTSINFPQPYPSYSQSCVFTGTAPVNTKVFMYCDVFDIFYNSNCNYARLTFSPSGDPNFADATWYCGYSVNLSLASSTNRFAMRFDNQWTNVNFQAGFRCYVAAFATPTTTTTKAPTTAAPTTAAPTTAAPTTAAPTTAAPTTAAPTTAAPTTAATTTAAPTTAAPTTAAPTTAAPTTAAPTTAAPTTAAPTTAAPTTAAPTTVAPTGSTQAPVCSCGVKNVVSRIVGGVAAQVNEYPWMAALRYKSNNAQYCGGALISNEWVITASHCLDINVQPTQISVTLGGHYRDLATDVPSSTTYNVQQIIIHEGWSDVTLDNDIGLVKLATPVQFTTKVSPICLPFPFPTSTFHGEMATVTGWGTTSYQGASSTTLLEVQMPVYANSQCKNTFASVQGNLTQNMFCTFAQGKDSCQGDSGGPLQYESGGRSYVIGVVSWGIGCANPDNPGVYAKVNNYLGWIKQKTASTFCGAV